MKKQLLAVALSFCSLIIGGQALAQEDLDRELLEFCKKSPLNSKCEGVEAPISLKERDGIEVECQLRFGGNDKLEGCKYSVEEDTLTVYVEVGEKIKVLDDLQPTQEIKITPENLLFFPTVTRSYQFSNKFGGGVIGNKIQYNQDVFFKVNDNEPSQNRSNRLSIYFKKSLNDSHGEKAEELLSFIEENQNFDTDKQKIAQEFAVIQSPIVNLSKEQAIQKLVSDNSCVRCDLSGADLTGIELLNANLEGANLANAILTNAIFDKAYLLGANLENAVLNNASFRFSELPYSSIAEANLQQTQIHASNLVGVNLANANLNNANFSYSSNLKSANLSNANLAGSTFKGINLDNTNLDSANLENATISINRIIDRNLSVILFSTFKNANLANANLANITAEGVIFNNANLSNAILTGSNLGLSTGRQDKLRLTNFLKEANLTNTNLSNSQLNRVDFSGANLQGANLTNTDTEAALFCETTLPDGSFSEENCED